MPNLRSTFLILIILSLNTRAQDINVATGWMHLVSDLLRKEAVPPPGCLRVYAYTGLALYESQVPALKKYRSLFYSLSGKKIPAIDRNMYHSPIAANTVIAVLLRKLSILKSQKEIDSLESFYQNFFQRQASQKQSDASRDFGRKIAEAIFEWSKTDGTFTINNTYSVPEAAGVWKPVTNGPNPPPGINQGSFRTFVKDAVSLTCPPPPPEYSTDTASVFYKNAKFTFEARNNINQSDSLLTSAWQNKYGTNHLTMGHVTKLLTLILEKEKYSVAEASLVYAKNGIAMFDAVASSFNAIYKYRVIRPVTFINSVMNHKNWNTLYPYDFYPSYPSNFACLVTASGTIFAETFGESYSISDTTQVSLYGSHHFTSIDDFIEKVTNLRILAGVDFPFTVEAGKIQGRRVAGLVNALLPRP